MIYSAAEIGNMSIDIMLQQKYRSLFHLCVLSFFSFILFSDYAVREPFFRFRADDALLHIGGGCALLTLWGLFIGKIVYYIIIKTLSLRWIAGIIWAIIVIFYLCSCPLGYIEEIQQLMLK